MPLPPDVPLIQQPYGPLVKFGVSNVLPPSAVYIAADDIITLEATNPTVNANLAVTLRILNPNGEVIPTLQEVVSINPVPNASTFTIVHTEGFLLSASVSVGNATQRGKCFVRLFIQRGGTVVGAFTGNVLIQGYVTNNASLTFPGGVIESPVSGRGNIRGVSFTLNGAGADATLDLPAGRSWIIHSISAVFVTSAAVVNRFPNLNVYFTIPSNRVCMIPLVGPCTAGVTYIISWAPGLSNNFADNVFSAGLPFPLIYTEQFGIKTATFNIDAADNYTQIVAMVEEFLAP